MYSETNKLIAEFMGAKIKSKRFDYMPTSSKNLSYDACYWFEDFNITYDGINVNNLKFHQSWDWLMLVVEKIENLNLKEFFYKWNEEEKIRYNFMSVCVDISHNYCNIYVELELDPPYEISLVTLNNKIESVYKAVINFINWYNEKNN